MIGATVPTTSLQVHVSQIVLSSEAAARDMEALLTSVPTMSFADQATAVSTDSATKDQGGDMDGS